MTDSRRSWLFWSGLAVAFSPVIQNLAEGLLAYPSQRYTLLPILLMGLLLRHDARSHTDTRPALGLALLIAGLAALVLGVAGASWTIARVGLPVAAVGMSFVTGRPAIAVILLSFALIPLPHFVQQMTTPQLESMLVEVGSGVMTRLGIELEGGGPLLLYHGERFELEPYDGGIMTAIVLSQFGWYVSLRAGRTLGQCVVRSFGWALLAVIVQPILVVVCIASLPLGIPDVGRFFLTHGLWLIAGLVALVLHTSARTGTSQNGKHDLAKGS